MPHLHALGAAARQQALAAAAGVSEMGEVVCVCEAAGWGGRHTAQGDTVPALHHHAIAREARTRAAEHERGGREEE